MIKFLAVCLANFNSSGLAFLSYLLFPPVSPFFYIWIIYNSS